MLVPRPRLSLRDVIEEPPPRLPPPPRVRRRLQRRFARGSSMIAPAYMNVRELAPPSGWSRVERVKLPAPPRDRLAARIVGALSLLALTLTLTLTWSLA